MAQNERVYKKSSEAKRKHELIEGIREFWMTVSVEKMSKVYWTLEEGLTYCY